MVRLFATAILATIACVPIGMIQMHSSFKQSLMVGLTIGALIVMSPFFGGTR